MSPKQIRWRAALVWMLAGMVVAFIALTRFFPEWKNGASAAPAAPAAPAPSASPPPSTSVDARALSQAFIQVAARLKPAVVKITIEKRGGGPEEEEGGGSPFDDFFRRFHNQGPRRMLQRGVGSGFVIDKAGHVLTNNHVVEGADRVQIVLSDGRRLKGKVVGSDKKDDLAVVKVEGKLDVTPVAFGDSDKLQPGELVMAIGSPLGLDQTVTVGVISAKGRRFGDTGPYAFEDFLQTDAAITHGNSGGPLVNMNGEVVGVNSRIAGDAAGIGFSVSSNIARRVATALIKDGRIRRPYIGVSLRDLTPEMAPFFKTDRGVVVQDVVPGSPAAKAGIASGDVIVKVDGHEVTASEQVVRSVQAHQVGQPVSIELVRNGSGKKLTLTAAEAPEEVKTKLAAGRDSDSPRGKFGLRLESLSPEDAQQLGVKASKGAVVVEVEPAGPAEQAGLQQGDVITEVDRKPVASADAAASALKGGGTHLLRIERRGSGSVFLTLSPEGS